MRADWLSIVAPAIQADAIGPGIKGVYLKGAGGGSGHFCRPIPLNLEAPAKSSTFAAFNGCRCLVKIEQRRQASLFTGVDPINDYSDRVEAAFGPVPCPPRLGPEAE